MELGCEILLWMAVTVLVAGGLTDARHPPNVPARPGRSYYLWPDARFHLMTIKLRLRRRISAEFNFWGSDFAA
jgi:hypothetical protein